MKSSYKIVLIVGAAVLFGWGAGVLSSSLSHQGDVEDAVVVATTQQQDAKEGGAASRDVRTTRVIPVSMARKAEVQGRSRPTFELDEEEESSFTDEQKELIALIRKALDEENFADLVKLVKRMQKSNLWPHGYPVSIRKAAIEALGWFGPDALPEVIGFLGDDNEEVLEAAIEAYEMAMQDANGDAELSLLLITACQAINDRDAVESFLMELNNMRNSVAVKTIKEISVKGTLAAKEALGEAMEFLTGEEGMTVDKLDKWYNDPSGDNLDDPDAEEFYGQTKDED